MALELPWQEVQILWTMEFMGSSVALREKNIDTSINEKQEVQILWTIYGVMKFIGSNLVYDDFIC